MDAGVKSKGHTRLRAPPLTARHRSKVGCAMTEQISPDHHGRFVPGEKSPNPAGRGKGSKNRYPRRHADRARAAKWTPHDWAVFYRRTLHETDGDVGRNTPRPSATVLRFGSYFILLSSAPGCVLTATSLST